MPAPVLDTDVLSELFKGHNDHVRQLAHDYLHRHGTYFFSVVTRYEVFRGLKAGGTSALEERFRKLCDRSWILPVTGEAADHAAEIYADLKANGQLVGDADILIAGTARSEGRAVVTRNVSHYSRMQGLTVKDWRDP